MATQLVNNETNNVRVISWPITEREPIDGSIIGECCQYHKQLWLSPSSQKIIEIQSCPLYCIYCAKIEPDDIVKWAPEGVKELKKQGS